MHTHSRIIDLCKTLCSIAHVPRVRYYGIKGLNRKTVLVRGFSKPKTVIWQMTFFFKDKDDDLEVSVSGKRFKYTPDSELQFVSTG